MTAIKGDRSERPHSLRKVLAGKSPLIPVIRIEDADDAEPLLAALEEAGLTAIEVTLRTPAALDVIKRMNRVARGAIIGAGTVTSPEQFSQVSDAGAHFAVSPALTPSLADAAHKSGLSYLPGVATPSEALRARELGFVDLKFFPANLMGGPGAIDHMAPLYPELKFCPTGGVNDATVASYLSLTNVFAAGGVYLAPYDLIKAKQWKKIEETARRSVEVACALSSG